MVVTVEEAIAKPVVHRGDEMTQAIVRATLRCSGFSEAATAACSVVISTDASSDVRRGCVDGAAGVCVGVRPQDMSAIAPPEPYLSKKQLASHYGYTTRWVELRMAEGMPSRLIGGRRRFLLSVVDAWLDDRADGD